MATGALGALIAIANTAAVVGFGGVAKLTGGFQAAVDFMTHLPGEPLIGAAIAVSVIAGLTGSASGGQTIALPLIAPHYLDQGVEPRGTASRRVDRVRRARLAAAQRLRRDDRALDLPRVLRGGVSGVAALTVIIPVLGAALAVVLFSF
jgi:hypothetical protein